MEKIETLTKDEIAKALGLSPTAIPDMILNGTLPIGCAYKRENASRVVIIKKRWEKWIEGKDLSSN